MKKVFFTLAALIILVLNSYSQEPEMILVEGGDFYMGNTMSAQKEEKPEHKVTLNDFYISVYEVTFDEYDLFCEARGLEKPDDGGFGRGKHPVMNISWDDAVMFCNYLSRKYKLDQVYEIKNDTSGFSVTYDLSKNGYRLPTEAEWEYAATGGNKSEHYAYVGSNDPKETTWFAENSGDRPSEVGKLKPNELGIYDMGGNAWEWCNDFYDAAYYFKTEASNPKGPEKGTTRVYRGANFASKKETLRPTRRFSLGQAYETGMIGIRLVKGNK